MEIWRDLALMQMPSLKKILLKAENPMDLWIKLEFRLDDAYEAQGRLLIRQIYDYAHWSYFESQDEDVTGAVACAFYEHLPLNLIVKEDLPNWLTCEEFKTLASVLHYHQSDKEFEQLRGYFDCVSQESYEKRK
jgi:hypothetical protein